jgi:hypothetical protein
MTTPPHSFRCSDDVWRAAQAKAASEGKSISDVVRQLLEAYVANSPAPPQLPTSDEKNPAGDLAPPAITVSKTPAIKVRKNVVIKPDTATPAGCPGFEPAAGKPSICKHCDRLKMRH